MARVAKLETYSGPRLPSGEVMCTTISRSGEAFFTVMPRRRTSSGSRGSAMATRFCTSTCAWSTSVPWRNTTLTVRRPSPVDWEDR